MNLSQTTPKRITYIDAAKGIGILAVMYGHITELGNPFDRWLSTFKLVIFFIISGWLMSCSDNIKTIDFKTFFKKKFNSLLLPYAYFSIIVIAYKIFVKILRGNSFRNILKTLIVNAYTTLSFRGISALWFLTALFFAEIIFYFVIRSSKLLKGINVIIALIISLTTAPVLALIKTYVSDTLYDIISMPVLAITKGIFGFLCIYAGYIAYKLISPITNRHNRLYLGVILFAINLFIHKFNSGTLDLNSMRMGSVPAIFIIGNIFCSLGIMLILEFFEKYTSYKLLSWCGRNSLILMATHGTLGFKAVLLSGFAHVVHVAENVCFRYYLECTIILGYLLIFEYAIVEFINNKCGFLIGKKRKS